MEQQVWAGTEVPGWKLLELVSDKIGHLAGFIKDLKVFHSRRDYAPGTYFRRPFLPFTNLEKLVIKTQWTLGSHFETFIPKTRLVKNDKVSYNEWTMILPNFLPFFSTDLINTSVPPQD